jgi:chromosome segregation ATPase
MPSRKRYSEEVIELANLIWGECRGDNLLLDSRGRPSYIIALNLADILLKKAYDVGFSDPLMEIDWRSIIDCSFEYPEMISEFERWLRDSVGKSKSLDEMVYSDLDLLRLNIQQLEGMIRELEEATPEKLAELGMTEEDRQKQLEELRSDLEKLQGELKKLEKQRMTKRRVRAVVREPEREKTKKIIETIVRRPKKRLDTYIKYVVLDEFIKKPEVEALPSEEDEELVREAQHIYNEFVSFHNQIVKKLKPVTDKLNALIKQLSDLEKQFKEASEAEDLERLRQLLPKAQKLVDAIKEASQEALQTERDTLAQRVQWRNRKVEAKRKLFNLKEQIKTKKDVIDNLVKKIDELKVPSIEFEAPPEWEARDRVDIIKRAEQLVKRISSRISELEIRKKRVIITKRTIKDLMSYEDFLNKLRERLEYLGIPLELISKFIAEVEEDLKLEYETASYLDLDEIISRYITYFKTEYLPGNFILLSATLLANMGVRVEHPRHILLYGMWVRPRISYIRPRFDSWIHDVTVSGFTVKNKPITVKPGKTHLLIDPSKSIEQVTVAISDDTIYLINAPAIGYVFDPEARYVEYYYYPACLWILEK